jgi:hypothetical protein
MAIIDALKLTPRLKGYRLHDKPLGVAALRASFWESGRKQHKKLSDRDVEFLKRYADIALAAGVLFKARGIELSGQGFVRPDLAVMNSCIKRGLVALNEDSGVFELTEEGLRRGRSTI